jgi:hypothetical protein
MKHGTAMDPHPKEETPTEEKPVEKTVDGEESEDLNTDPGPDEDPPEDENDLVAATSKLSKKLRK